MCQSRQLSPLNRYEIESIIEKIKSIHAAAFGWNPSISVSELFTISSSSAYLVRTIIRTVVEYLDSCYLRENNIITSQNKLQQDSDWFPIVHDEANNNTKSLTSQYKSEVLTTLKHDEMVTEKPSAFPVKIDVSRLDIIHEEHQHMITLLAADGNQEKGNEEDKTEIQMKTLDTQTNEYSTFVGMLTEEEHTILIKLLDSDDISKIANVEMIIESINETAFETIGDIVIGLSIGGYIIYEEYANEIREALS